MAFNRYSATTRGWKVPQTGSERYLGGVGLDWNVPSFSFVKTNFYIRDNPALSGTTWGTTFSWKKKFSIGAQPFLFDGFVDMAGAEGDRSAYQLAVPALLADIGTHMGYKDRLYLGTEYQYWHNKFLYAIVAVFIAAFFVGHACFCRR